MVQMLQQTRGYGEWYNHGPVLLSCMPRALLINSIPLPYHDMTGKLFAVLTICIRPNDVLS